MFMLYKIIYNNIYNHNIYNNKIYNNNNMYI